MSWSSWSVRSLIRTIFGVIAAGAVGTAALTTALASGPGAPDLSALENPPGVTVDEIKTSASFQAGLNAFVLLGGGTGPEITTALGQLSGQSILALWVFRSEQWQVYIPAAPFLGTMAPITQDAAALFAVLQPPIVPTTPPPASTPTSAPAPTPAQATVYVVQFGDTLSEIAVPYYSSSFELADLNNLLDRQNIPAGLRILVPGPTASLATVSLASLPTVLYTVQAGDSLTDLAQVTNVSLGLLAQLNGLSAGSTLQVGQKLKLPQ